MNQLTSLFDYIFYRIYSFFKVKGDNVPETKGTLLLSLMQCLTLVDIDVLLELFFNYTFFSSKYSILIPGIIFVGFNWFKYEREFDISRLDTKWKDEDQIKRVRNGWFISLYLIVSFLIPIVFGYLKVNLKVI